MNVIRRLFFKKDKTIFVIYIIKMFYLKISESIRGKMRIVFVEWI